MADKDTSHSKEMIVSDLAPLATPEGLNDTDINRWRVIPYEAEDFSGTMLGHGPGFKPVPLSLSLGVKGTWDIYVGIYGFTTHGRLRVRLSKDRTCRRLGTSVRGNSISAPFAFEYLFKRADLTGQNLIVEPGYDPSPYPYPSAITHIRLVPAVPDESGQPEAPKHPMAFTNDGHGIFGHFPHSRPEDLLESFEEIPPDSCARILLWGMGEADLCNYPTAVGQNDYDIPSGSSYYMHSRRIFHHNLELWKQKGWNSLEVVRDYARSRNWEFQAYIRMEAFNGQFPHEFIRSRFFHEHPEYHCFDREGTRVMRLSYAHPEVQDHMTRLIAEISGYQPDGVCLCFIRGIPIVLYEPIMVESFQKQYGLDPRELDELDPRWLDYQAKVVTPLIEKAKKAIKPGQRLSVIVPGNERDCRRWGLDVADWIHRGLVDDVLPTGQTFTEEDVHIDGPEHLDYDWFDGLEGRRNIRLIPMLYPWAMFYSDEKAWREILLSFLARGADAYAVWDAEEANRFPKVGYLGCAKPTERPPKTPEFRRIHIKTMNGYRYDRYHHYEVI